MFLKMHLCLLYYMLILITKTVFNKYFMSANSSVNVKKYNTIVTNVEYYA